jgi:hypothetical protein
MPAQRRSTSFGEHVLDVLAIDEAVLDHVVDRARLGQERRASPRVGAG